MADFYTEMNQMTRDLLAPTSNGGLGQGTVKITRTTITDPDDPWNSSTTDTETIRAAVRGMDKQLVGAEVGGTIITATDRIAICEVPDMGYKPGDKLEVDGKDAQIISFEPIPAAGITAAVRFIIRG